MNRNKIIFITDRFQIDKIVVDKQCRFIVLAKPLTCRSYSFRIRVDSEQLTAWRNVFENSGSMTTTSQRAVDVSTARLYGECLNYLFS